MHCISYENSASILKTKPKLVEPQIIKNASPNVC